MMEIFDMGKYDFFVWGSIGVFVGVLVIDFINARGQNKKIKKLIKAQIRKKESRSKQA